MRASSETSKKNLSAAVRDSHSTLELARAWSRRATTSRNKAWKTNSRKISLQLAVRVRASTAGAFPSCHLDAWTANSLRAASLALARSNNAHTTRRLRVEALSGSGRARRVPGRTPAGSGRRLEPPRASVREEARGLGRVSFRTRGVVGEEALDRRDMPVPAAPAVLFKLWVAKKLAVLLAARMYGLKKLYRGGMRLNNRFVTDPWAHGKVRSVMHSMAAGAMKMGDKFERPARRYMNKIMGYEEKPTKMS